VRPRIASLTLPRAAQSPHRGTAPELVAAGSAATGSPLGAAPSSQRPDALDSTLLESLSLPHRCTGLALCVRPSVRASASAALTQTLLKGVQRLGPERISSAARARPPQVAPALCRGTSPELVAPGSAVRSATPCAQRPWHAPCAISAAPSERRRPGQRAAPRGFCPSAEPAVPGASEGREGSPKRSAGPRMHEHWAHAWGAAKHSTSEVANAWGAAKHSTSEVANVRRAAKHSTGRTKELRT
jgi:hypothetical protein